MNVPSVNALPTCVGALSKPLDVANTPIMTPPVQVHPCDVSTVTEVADPAVTVTPCISAPIFLDLLKKKKKRKNQKLEIEKNKEKKKQSLSLP